MNSQDWFPLGWTGWISWQYKGLSRVFSNTTVQIYLGWDFLFRIASIPMNTWRCSNSENLNVENLRAAEGHLSGAEAKPGVQFYVRRAPASGNVVMDFPGAPVVKTPWFQCRGHHFDLWLGKIPHADWCGQNVKGKKKERKWKAVRCLGNILVWSSELRFCACWKSQPPVLTPVEPLLVDYHLLCFFFRQKDLYCQDLRIRWILQISETNDPKVGGNRMWQSAICEVASLWVKHQRWGRGSSDTEVYYRDGAGQGC